MELSWGLKIREVSSIVITATAALNQDNTRRLVHIISLV